MITITEDSSILLRQWSIASKVFLYLVLKIYDFQISGDRRFSSCLCRTLYCFYQYGSTVRLMYRKIEKASATFS
jgi:hypothetical protein